jgi:alginate O-acetyltransferase complex protein AlgJ
MHEMIEDDTADVVVIGNSYMQPKYNFAPALSNQLNRPVSLVWKVHLVGPYKTLLTYLGSESFRQHRPRAIVWNFHEVDMEPMTNSRAAWPQDAMTDEAFLADVRRAVTG